MRSTRPTKAELVTFQGATVDDLEADPLRLLFVGINPGLWTAATNTPFAHPANRFYPALAAAGIIPRIPTFSEGFTDADRRMFRHDDAADDRSHQDRDIGAGFHQPGAGQHLIVFQMLGQDRVFDRAEEGGMDTHRQQSDQHQRHILQQ